MQTANGLVVTTVSCAFASVRVHFLFHLRHVDSFPGIDWLAVVNEGRFSTTTMIAAAVSTKFHMPALVAWSTPFFFFSCRASQCVNISRQDSCSRMQCRLYLAPRGGEGRGGEGMPWEIRSIEIEKSRCDDLRGDDEKGLSRAPCVEPQPTSWPHTVTTVRVWIDRHNCRHWSPSRTEWVLKIPPQIPPTRYKCRPFRPALTFSPCLRSWPDEGAWDARRACRMPYYKMCL